MVGEIDSRVWQQDSGDVTKSHLRNLSTPCSERRSQLGIENVVHVCRNDRPERCAVSGELWTTSPFRDARANAAYRRRRSKGRPRRSRTSSRAAASAMPSGASVVARTALSWKRSGDRRRRMSRWISRAFFPPWGIATTDAASLGPEPAPTYGGGTLDAPRRSPASHGEHPSPLSQCQESISFSDTDEALRTVADLATVHPSHEHSFGRSRPQRPPVTHPCRPRDRRSCGHHRLRPLNATKPCAASIVRPARIAPRGHAMVQNIRRGHYDIAADLPARHRLRVAFDEVLLSI